MTGIKIQPDPFLNDGNSSNGVADGIAAGVVEGVGIAVGVTVGVAADVTVGGFIFDDA